MSAVRFRAYCWVFSRNHAVVLPCHLSPSRVMKHADRTCLFLVESNGLRGDPLNPTTPKPTGFWETGGLNNQSLPPYSKTPNPRMEPYETPWGFSVKGRESSPGIAPAPKPCNFAPLKLDKPRESPCSPEPCLSCTP